MAKTPTTVENTENIEEVTETPMEQTAAVEPQGIYILSADGQVLGEGYKSVSDAEAALAGTFSGIDAKVVG